MNCYQHRDQQAIGLCKHCLKAVCDTCVRDTHTGLACSDACVVEVEALNHMQQRAKRLYSAGSGISLVATMGMLFNTFIGLVFLAFGFYPLADGHTVNWFFSVMGAGFLCYGLVAYLKTKKSRSK